VSLRLHCDVCGKVSDPVYIYAELNGCACYSEAEAYVRTPDGWMHSDSGSECPKCWAEFQEKEAAKREAARARQDEELRRILEHMKPGKPYMSLTEAAELAACEMEADSE
jgi:hypothetical protein